MVQKMWLPLALTLLAGACLVPAQAAEKLSTVTPVADLVTEAETKIKDIVTQLMDSFGHPLFITKSRNCGPTPMPIESPASNPTMM